MATKDDKGPKAAYSVRSPLHHDGERFDMGDTVQLTEKQAARLPAGIVARVAEKTVEEPKK